MWEILLSGGVISGIVGLIFWWFKRWIEKRDKEKEERDKQREKEKAEHDKNVEKLIKYLIMTSRTTQVLAGATARAVQRIPDAHCNGDMTSALKEAAEIQEQENKFFVDQGLKHIFEE